MYFRLNWKIKLRAIRGLGISYMWGQLGEVAEGRRFSSRPSLYGCLFLAHHWGTSWAQFLEVSLCSRMPASTCHGGATSACSGFSLIPHMASVMDRIVLPLIRMLKPQPPTWLYFERGPLDASLVVQMVKNLPAMLETWLWSLGWEDLLEKGTVTNSSILAWRTPWTEEPCRLQSMGSQRVEYDWATFR